MTAIDVVEATIEQALGSVLALSTGDERLCSLVRVENDSRGMPPLLGLE